MDFCRKIFSFLTSYLTNRQICPKIDGVVSSPQIVDDGIPQGSVLGPLLFLLYVNDLPHASNFDTTLFADDTNLYLSHHNINILQSQVNQEINKINQWIISTKLTIDYKKSCCVIVSKRSLDTCNFNVSINHNKIKKKHVKYLGVYVDNKLTRKNQIDHLCSKISKVCGMVFKQRHYVPLSTLKLTLRKVMFYLLTSCNTEERIAQNIYIHNSNRSIKKINYKNNFNQETDRHRL